MNQKLSEAQYFLGLLEKDWSSPVFQHNLSAFLSALMSTVEHNRLHASDPRFKDWYKQAVDKYLKRPEMIELREYRRKEVHMTGTPTWQQISVIFPPEGPTHGMSWSINLSAPATPEELSEWPEPDTVPSTGAMRKKYVFEGGGNNDVLELCRTGFSIVREMMNDYSRQQFRNA